MLNDQKVTLLDIAKVYMKIGILGFGGGYAVLSLIRSEIVEHHQWLKNEQFDHILEFTAFSPGATTINVMTAIAYRLRGFGGVLIGLVSVLWPSFLLIMGLASALPLLHARWIQGAFIGVEAAVIGLLVGVVRTLYLELPKEKRYHLLVFIAFLITLVGINPAIVVLLSALAGAMLVLAKRYQSRTQK